MSVASSAATGGSVTSIEDDDISLASSKFGDGVGIMFDGSLPSKSKSFSFTAHEEHAREDAPTALTVHVELECVDDEPGAVQSGHYLWPASPALSQYLVDTYGSCPTNERENVKRIIELGAGCGLASLTAMQVFRQARCVVVSDYDPGTLTRARRSFESTMAKLRQIDTKQTINEIHIESSLPFPVILFEELRWGDCEGASNVMEATAIEIGNDAELSDLSNGQSGDVGYQLILASDVIYAKSVVAPFLKSVATLISKSEGSLMIMVQSFAYDEEVESITDSTCEELGLERSIVKDDLAGEGGMRIQTFRMKQ